MYRINKKGNPFLFKELKIQRSLFQSALKKVDVASSLVGDVHGSATHFDINRVIKAAIGENIERTSLYLNAGNFKEPLISALNLVTFEERMINIKQVLLCYHSKIFTHNNMSQHEYNDSCGVASHIESFQTLNAAFLEFIERQCFIHNWITTSPGKKIEIDTIESLKVKQLVNKAKRYVDEISFFDISLHPKVKVILSIGIGQKYMAMGLSANWNIEESMVGSLEELFQFFGASAPKDYLQDEEILFEGGTYEEAILNDPHYYSNLFFSTITPEKLKESYQYLFDTSKSIPYENIEVDVQSNFYKLIQEISQDLELEIFCVFIPSVLREVPTKIVKVLSNNGYPHMMTELLEPEKCILSQVFKNRKFPNKHRPIVFP